jgi:hypothetical protein
VNFLSIDIQPRRLTQQKTSSENTWSTEGFENYSFTNVMYYFLHRDFIYIETNFKHLKMMYNHFDDATVFITLADDTKYVEYVWSTSGRIKTTFKPYNIHDIYFIEKNTSALQGQSGTDEQVQ